MRIGFLLDNEKEAPIQTMTRVPKRQENSKVFIILGCVLFLGLVVLSFLPPGDKSALHTMGRFHLWGHTLAFAVMGYVAFRAAGSRLGRMVLILAAILSGLAIESGEHLVYRSSMEWVDVVMDSAGVLIGAVLAVMSTPKPVPGPDARWKR